MERLRKFVTVAALVAVFYLYSPLSFWDGIWLYLKFSFVVVVFHFLKNLLLGIWRNIDLIDWVPLFADFTWLLFRPWTRTEMLLIPADRFILIDNSLFFNGEPVFCEVEFDSWRNVLYYAGILKVKREKGILIVVW